MPESPATVQISYQEHILQTKPFYVYVHRRLSDGQIFYVGKGTVKHKRAFATNKRNPYWKRVFQKHGRAVEIYSFWNTSAEAYEEEKKLVSFFRKMGCPLANITEGGDGSSGYVMTTKMRQKIAETKNQKIFVVFTDGSEKIFISQKEASKFFGVSANTVSKWCRGLLLPKTRLKINHIVTKKDQ